MHSSGYHNDRRNHNQHHVGQCSNQSCLGRAMRMRRAIATKQRVRMDNLLAVDQMRMDKERSTC